LTWPSARSTRVCPCLNAPGVRALLDHAHEVAPLPSAVEAIKENEQEFIVILRRG
jgi:hypothetical protein